MSPTIRAAPAEAAPAFARRRFALSEGSRYGVVLLLLVCDVLVTIIAPGGAWSALVTTGLQGAAVLAALTRPSTSNALRIIMGAGILAGVALAATAANDAVRGLAGLVNAAVILALPAIIVARFRRNLSVNVQSVLGAVCIYLVIG